MYSFKNDLNEYGQALQFVLNRHLSIDQLILVGGSLGCLEVFFSLLDRPLSIHRYQDLSTLLKELDAAKVEATGPADLVIIETSHQDDLGDFEALAKALSAKTKNVLCLFDWDSVDPIFQTTKYKQCLFSFCAENFFLDEMFRVALWNQRNISPYLKTSSLMFKAGSEFDQRASVPKYPIVDYLHPDLMHTGRDSEIKPSIVESLQRLEKIESSFTWQVVLRGHSILDRRPRLKKFLRNLVETHWFSRS